MADMRLEEVLEIEADRRRRVTEAFRGFQDGAWLCELAPLANPALIADALAHALGVDHKPEGP